MRHRKDVKHSVLAVIVLWVGVEVVGVIEPAEVPIHVVVEREHEACQILCLGRQPEDPERGRVSIRGVCVWGGGGGMSVCGWVWVYNRFI